MKGKILNKARLAGAVMLATAGIAAGTAQADSMLAPLVVSDTTNGFETFFFYKMRGTGSANANFGETSQIHYTTLRKLAPVGGFVSTDGLAYANDFGDLFNATNRTSAGCVVENTFGVTSPWDLVVQSASGNNLLDAIPGTTDQTVTNGYPASATGEPFYGMFVIDDVANLDGNIYEGEGDASGFAYIVDISSGEVLDYKLLNNHLSKASGDFSAGFISKTAIDHMWAPNALVAASAPTRSGTSYATNAGTVWYTAVTGVGMTSAAELDGQWAQSVVITQDDANLAAGDRPASSVLPIFQVNPALPAGPGVYNNDENVTSGRRNTDVTCLGMYTSDDVQTTSQAFNTRTTGGWKRSHIRPTTGATLNGAEANGAFTYRFDNIGSVGAVAGFPAAQSWTMQPETGGHLNTGALGNHPNRPY